MLHILPGLYMKQPTIFADEIGYLANARYLSGAAPHSDLRGCTYYQFGYSLFLVPVFRLFSDPVTDYRVIILLNAFLISSTYFAIYYILSRLLTIGKRISIWASFVACLYPSALLQSNYAWSENAVLPLYAFLIAAYGYLLIRKTRTAALLFGVLTGLLYATHPRAISLAPLAVCFLIVLAWTRTIPRLAVAVGSATILLVVVATSILDRHLLLAGWGSTNSSQALILPILYFLSTFAGFKEYVLLLSGGILYLLQATYGLFSIGVLFLVFKKLSRPNTGLPLFSDVSRSTCLFLLSSTLFIALSMTAAMVLFISPTAPETGDYLIFGRYNEAFVLPYIALAIVALESVSKNLSRKAGRRTMSAIAVLTALVLLGWNQDLWAIRVNPVDIWALYPAVRMFGEIRPALMSGIALLLFLILKFTFRKTFAGGCALLASIFLFVTACDYRIWVIRNQRTAQQATVLHQAINQLKGIEKISYDDTFFNTLQFYTYQFLCPHMKFERFYSDNNQLPVSAAVISGRNWRWAKDRNLKPMASEAANGISLWLVPMFDSSLYTKVNLATSNVPGMVRSGFFEKMPKQRRFVRWTDGNAKIEVPIGPNSFSALRITLAGTGPDGATITILANDEPLYTGYVNGRWRKELALKDLPKRSDLVIEVRSDTFVPASTLKRSPDERTLGVLVENIQLVTSGSH